MDLNYSAADDAFRAEVRAWLEANLPADISSKILNHRRPSRDDLVRWHKLLAGRGWSAPHWPSSSAAPAGTPRNATSGTRKMPASARLACCRSAWRWSRP
jgi:alkylation response protein AidB-like acyl-CoA dehydrogenase